MISTRQLSQLPLPSSLRSILQALAMLDAILEEEWEYRYYSYNAHWSETEHMASMRTGSGDDFFAVFDACGCFLRGFAHEAAMAPANNASSQVWPGVLDTVPSVFRSSLNEAAFHMQDTTFCIWCQAGDAAWSCGVIEFPEGEDDPDGSQWMLTPLDGKPETYQAFAQEYYELDVDLSAITRIFAHEPLTAELVAAFSTSRTLEDILIDAEEIGYHC
ncbi:hypothetical protein ACO0LF_18115 [Undibacterium sp. Di27W]|uniref:hypothetical protein n=1 Tax=Undibacterium sp. Di27W TaxID=3413036 RepID=UPI003BEF775D